LGEKGFYFDPFDEKQLATILLKFNAEKISKPNFNYEEKSKYFGIQFMEIIKKLK
jgi:hypothetical protein